MVEIKTYNLKLRHFNYSDEEYIHKFKGMSRDEFLKREKNIDYFAIELNGYGKAIGEICANYDKSSNEQDTFRIWINIDPYYQKLGFGQEAIGGFAEYLFKYRNAKRINAYPKVTDMCSQHLCEDLGMKKMKELVDVPLTMDEFDGMFHYTNTYQYSILEKEWDYSKYPKYRNYAWVDLVMCIDRTQSMEAVLDSVKKQAVDSALRTKELFNKIHSSKRLCVRVKLITFGCIKKEGENAIKETEFYNVNTPDEILRFTELVNSIQAYGGSGNGPEDALEAFIRAVQTLVSLKDGPGTSRHRVILWTDDEPIPLGRENGIVYKKKRFEKTEDLFKLWESECMYSECMSIALFAPDRGIWSDFSDNMSNIIHYPSNAGEGIDECDFDTINSCYFWD